jgi:hypothetical protein
MVRPLLLCSKCTLFVKGLCQGRTVCCKHMLHADIPLRKHSTLCWSIALPGLVNI